MAFYFEQLIVWQKSLLLAKIIHETIQSFPPEEKYALTKKSS